MAEHEHNACTRTKCMLILSEFPLKIINKYHCNQFPRGVENALDTRCHAAHSRVFALVLSFSLSLTFRTVTAIASGDFCYTFGVLIA